MSVSASMRRLVAQLALVVVVHAPAMLVLTVGSNAFADEDASPLRPDATMLDAHGLATDDRDAGSTDAEAAATDADPDPDTAASDAGAEHD